MNSACFPRKQTSIVRLGFVARVRYALAVHVGYGRFNLGLILTLHDKGRTESDCTDGRGIGVDVALAPHRATLNCKNKLAVISR